MMRLEYGEREGEIQTSQVGADGREHLRCREQTPDTAGGTLETAMGLEPAGLTSLFHPSPSTHFLTSDFKEDICSVIIRDVRFIIAT
jgi:hypothetical protein